MKYLKRLEQNIYLFKSYNNEPLSGISEDEIKMIEDKMETILPLEYREFLLLAGKNMDTALFNLYSSSFEQKQKNIISYLDDMGFIPNTAILPLHSYEDCTFAICNQNEQCHVFHMRLDDYHEVKLVARSITEFLDPYIDKLLENN